MSRSYRKIPIIGNAGSRPSEKWNKRKANRKNRRVNKGLLRTIEDEIELKYLRETSDTWVFAKDGKFWFNAYKEPKLKRK